MDLCVDGAEGESKLWVVEARDMARGFCGALFLALPLLYTLEMWERARAVPAWDMALIVVMAYLANVGFALFDGFKPDLGRKVAWFDALTAMGIGLLASAVTLLLIGRYSFADTPANVIIPILLLEMVPASFGANLAINQLGSRGGGCSDSKSMIEMFSSDFCKIMGTILGALMFAFNVAPTIEPKVITYQTSWWHTLGILLFSLGISYVMVFFSNFVNREGQDGVLRLRWVETLVSYIVSLTISALLLWMFGYLGFGMSLATGVAWVVTLGYATTLGGAAGRLVL